MKLLDQFSATFLSMEHLEILAKEIKKGKSLRVIADTIGVDPVFLAEASLQIVRYFKYIERVPSSTILQLEKALEEYDRAEFSTKII